MLRTLTPPNSDDYPRHLFTNTTSPYSSCPRIARPCLGCSHLARHGPRAFGRHPARIQARTMTAMFVNAETLWHNAHSIPPPSRRCRRSGLGLEPQAAPVAPSLAQCKHGRSRATSHRGLESKTPGQCGGLTGYFARNPSVGFQDGPGPGDGYHPIPVRIPRSPPG